MLYYAIVTLHVIVCIILVLVVLLQSGKGADLAGAFGGGATQTAFGSRGPASFLSKMTTMAAVIFMITSITLTLISSSRLEAKSLLETSGKQTARPVQKQPAAETAAPKTAGPSQEDIERIQKEVQEKIKQQQAAPAPSAPVQEKKPVKE